MSERLDVTRRAVVTTFRSLGVRNYRLYFFGQAVSVSGSWMQRVAQAWLVLHLTGSGAALGATLALQSLPMFLLGVWGGLIADRADKRHLLLLTQSLASLQAVTLGLLTLTGTVQLWILLLLALALGCTTAVDNLPARPSRAKWSGRDWSPTRSGSAARSSPQPGSWARPSVAS